MMPCSRIAVHSIRQIYEMQPDACFSALERPGVVDYTFSGCPITSGFSC